ncbi:hypothetical protein BKI52_28275 [marine bacterium AO1-C]|nr:hypothetical protein BKI52_28275 [marine bacterium AO1-C]
MNKLAINITATLSLILCITIAAQAQRSVSIKNGLKATLPAGWKTEKNDLGELIMVSPGGKIDLTFSYMSGKSVNKILAEYDNYIASEVKNFREVSKGQEEKINGLPTYYIEGEGKMEGIAVNIGVHVVGHGSNVLLVFVVIDKSASQKGADIMNGILDSIRR